MEISQIEGCACLGEVLAFFRRRAVDVTRNRTDDGDRTLDTWTLDTWTLDPPPPPEAHTGRHLESTQRDAEGPGVEASTAGAQAGRVAGAQ